MLKNARRVLVVAVLCALFLCACSNKKSVEKQILGKWYSSNNDTDGIEFLDNGVCIAGSESMSWSIANENILVFTESGGSVSYPIVEITKDKFVIDGGTGTQTFRRDKSDFPHDGLEITPY